MAVLTATDLALSCPRPVSAQQSGTWTFPSVLNLHETRINGNIETSFPYGAPSSIYSGGISGAVLTGAVNGDYGSASGIVSIKGQAHIMALWTPPSGVVPIPTPPATVTVLIHSGVWASFDPYGPHPAQVQSPQLNNGFDDPVVSFPAIPLPGATGEWSSSGLHLKTFGTAGYSIDSTYTQGTRYKLELPLDIDILSSMKASGTGYNPNDDDGASTVGFIEARLIDVTATGDTRTVQITSGSFGAPNFRKSGDPHDEGAQVENKRNADGSMSVDSALQLRGTQFGNQGLFGCSASLPGFTSPTYDWSYSGVVAQGYLPPAAYRNANLVAGLTFGGFSSGPWATTVTLDATDTDGTKGTNTLSINWHLPYEKTGTSPTTHNPKVKLRALVGPISYPTSSVAWVPSPAETFDYGAVIDGASVLATVSGQEEVAGYLELFKAVSGLTKLAEDYPGGASTGQPISSYSNNQDTWNNTAAHYSTEGNFPAGALSDPLGFMDYDLWIWEVKHSDHESWVCDKYVASGYDSSGHVFSADVVTGIDQQAYYTLSQILH